MKKVIVVLLLFSFTHIIAQKGAVTVYFKNGEIASGKGKLKGVKYINFKEDSSKKNKKLSFDDLDKVEMTLKNGQIMTFRLHPIVKKDGTRKTPSVIGKLVSGKINLYIKGNINNANITGTVTFNNTGVGGMSQEVGVDRLIHYFMKKDGETDAIHLKSNQYTLKQLLQFTGKTFDECPEVFSKLYLGITKENTLEEFIKQYNTQCK